MAVPILKQSQYLIATIQSVLTDADLVELRNALVTSIGRHRSRGVIVDVTALEVLDSFASRSLRGADLEEGLEYLNRKFKQHGT